ncbi:MAG: chemotaxis protein CheR [Devosiaceae bacterium]|nr:chemotaxis protein CheR [Devosiaceae bacterium]
MKEQNNFLISKFVQKHSGIVLGSSKSYLIETRLTPIAEQFGFKDVDELAYGLGSAASDLKNAVIDAMTTNESFFFRDNVPFEAFEKIMLPELIATARKTNNKIRIWCAAASTGQEPYSLAMILLANKRLWSGINIEIIGTDLSDLSLERAKVGKYTQFEVQRGLPVQMLVEHFKQQGTAWFISDEIKNMVKFSKSNLLEPFGLLGKMDIVFCRNVLIYFDTETKAKVVKSVYDILRLDGYLVLGGAETLLGISDLMERAEGYRGLYRSAGAKNNLTALSA